MKEFLLILGLKLKMELLDEKFEKFEKPCFLIDRSLIVVIVENYDSLIIIFVLAT